MLAYEEFLRRQAFEHYKLLVLSWSSIAPHARKKMDAPKVPGILNGKR